MKWDDSYSVGISVFDDHHKKLIGMIESLSKLEEEDEKAIHETITELMDYTQYHFEEEEKQLAEYEYPELDKQKEEHNDFIASVNVFQKSFDFGIVPPITDVLEFLKKWLTDHIKISDKKYSDFLTGKGLS